MSLRSQEKKKTEKFEFRIAPTDFNQLQKKTTLEKREMNLHAAAASCALFFRVQKSFRSNFFINQNVPPFRRIGYGRLPLFKRSSLSCRYNSLKNSLPLIACDVLMELYETISLPCETLCNSHTYFTIYRSEVRWAVAAPPPAVPLSPHTARMEKLPMQRCVSMCGFDSYFFFFHSVRFALSTLAK